MAQNDANKRREAVARYGRLQPAKHHRITPKPCDSPTSTTERNFVKIRHGRYVMPIALVIDERSLIRKIHGVGSDLHKGIEQLQTLGYRLTVPSKSSKEKIRIKSAPSGGIQISAISHGGTNRLDSPLQVVELQLREMAVALETATRDNAMKVTLFSGAQTDELARQLRSLLSGSKYDVIIQHMLKITDKVNGELAPWMDKLLNPPVRIVKISQPGPVDSHHRFAIFRAWTEAKFVCLNVKMRKHKPLVQRSDKTCAVARDRFNP